MKKVIVILTILVVILAGILGYFGIKLKKANVKISDLVSNKTEVVVVETNGKNYGNRGNISQTEKIKFLTHNDEYVVGMIGLEKSTVEKEFTNDDMIRFALNVAVHRYQSTLTTKKTQKGTTGYLVPTSMVNDLTSEFFGISNVSFNQNTNPYYSKSNKAFILDQEIAVSLYYYPVSFDQVEVEIPVLETETAPTTATNTAAETAETSENVVENEVKIETPKEKYIFITCDAIFVPDENTEDFERAKYEGIYEEKDVDNTIKFKFNSYGKLVSYQNM